LNDAARWIIELVPSARGFCSLSTSARGSRFSIRSRKWPAKTDQAVFGEARRIAARRAASTSRGARVEHDIQDEDGE
jgi:hypothetical protein